MSFARTKIQPPRKQIGLIARPALEAHLADALATRRLALISAPAGFGKSAALTRQIARLPESTAMAWISVDEDDDLPRLLDCLFTALEPFDLPWRVAPEALVAAVGHTRSERRAVADELLNTLAATDATRGLIMLDDAHRIQDPAVFEFLDLLIERLPDAWGIVIASRIDPPLALARLRAAGELAEFRIADLRFGRDEVASLAATLDAQGRPTPTSEADAELLLSRTGGWAVGLRLLMSSAASAGRGEAAAAGHGIEWARVGRTMDRHVFDYLAAEVLDDMPIGLREFLLRCSVLSELTAARCAAVSGDQQAAQRLAEIERRELFVSVLEGAERTLRLHDLFRDFLDDRLRREYAHELPDLMRRAAAGETDPVRRIAYLLRAPAWDEAAMVLADQGPALLNAGANDAVVRLIEQFPGDVRDSSPLIQRVRGLAAWARWDWATMGDAMQRSLAVSRTTGERQAARAYLAIAFTGLGRHADTHALLQELRKEALDGDALLLALLVETWAAFDDFRFRDLPGLLERQLDALEQTDSVPLWYQCIPNPPYIGLPGMRAPLQRYVQGALARVPATTTTLRALARGMQGGLLAIAGRYDEALEVLREAESDVRWLGRPLNASSMVYGQLAFTHTLRGERDAAMAFCEFHLEQNRRSADPANMVRVAFVAYCSGRMALAMGDEAKARELFAMVSDSQRAGERPALKRHRAALPAYRALLDGDLPRATAAFEQALADADAIDLFGHASEARLRLALCLVRSGRVADAAHRLEPVFARHRDNIEMTPVLMAGPRVLRELANVPWGSALDDELAALLQRWAALAEANQVGRQSTQERPPSVAVTGASAPTKPADRAIDVGSRLSVREAEVLRRIASGDSNKLIARAFNLSPHTVKRHVANILDKLGLASRGQAAAWFREHR